MLSFRPTHSIPHFPGEETGAQGACVDSGWVSVGHGGGQEGQGLCCQLCPDAADLTLRRAREDLGASHPLQDCLLTTSMCWRGRSLPQNTLPGLIICWKGLQNTLKAIIFTVMIYYKEGTQVKRNQRKRHPGQSLETLANAKLAGFSPRESLLLFSIDM